MTKAQIEIIDAELHSSGLTGDGVDLTDPFWGQIVAHAEIGAEMISERGADFTRAQAALCEPYLVVRAIETLYFGEPTTDFPEEIAERVLSL